LDPARPRLETLAIQGFGLLFFVALAGNQLITAALLGLALLKLLGPRALPLRRSILSLALTATAAVSGLFLAQAIAQGPEHIADRQFLRLFFAMPVPFYRLLFFQQPITVLVVLLGAFLLFPRSLRPGADQRAFGLLGFFWAALLLMGLFRSPYVIHRYTYYLNPALITLFAVCTLQLARALAQQWPKPRHCSVLTFAIAIGLVTASEQFDPLQSWAATQRGYGYARDLLSDPDLVSHFYYDYGSCAEFVLADRSPGDITLAKEPVELYPYGLSCDYRLNEIYGVYAMTPAGKPVDWYLGIPIISTVRGLSTLIESTRASGRSVYIIYTKPDPLGPAIHLPDEVLALLERYGDRIVHTAEDGLTVVIRLRPAES
jgi:hypothetical protein